MLFTILMISIFVTGKAPVKVYATTRNTIRGNDAEDSASVLIEYENGVTATYALCDGTPSPWNYDLAADENESFVMAPGENSMQVFGTKGSLDFRIWTCTTMTRTHLAGLTS